MSFILLLNVSLDSESQILTKGLYEGQTGDSEILLELNCCWGTVRDLTFDRRLQSVQLSVWFVDIISSV